METQFQVLQKVVAAMFTSVSRSMANALEQDIAYSLSGVDVVEKHQDFPVSKFTEAEWFVEAGFQLDIGLGQEIVFHLCISIQLAKQLAGILTQDVQEEVEEA